MLPILFATSRRCIEALLIIGLTLLLLLGGAGFGRLTAGSLPPWGVDDFRTLIDSKRAPNPEPAIAGQTLATYRRRLRKAAADLPSLGEVSRVLLMTEWSSTDLFGLEAVVPKDQVERAVRQKDDEAFKRDVDKLMEGHADNPGEIRDVNQAIVAEIKSEVRQQLLERLENRTRYYLAEGRNADRVAAANMISEIMNTSRRQDISQYRPAGSTAAVSGVLISTEKDVTPSSRYLRQRLRSLSGDLDKLIADSDTQVRVAAIRALSDLEREPAELVARLKPLLASQQSDAPTRRAAAEALGHVLEVYTAQMDKSRPQPYLTAVEQVLPAAAEGLSDSDPLVRRAAQESCQRAALVLEELATDPLASSERRIVFRPTLAVVLAILPKLNDAARDRVPELRVGASHILETFALSVQRMRYRGSEPLPPPDIDRDIPMPQPNKQPSKYKKQTSLPPSRSARENAPVVSLGRPIILPASGGDKPPLWGIPQGAYAPRSPSLIQTASFRTVQLDELPPPIPVGDTGIQGTVQTMIENLKHADYRVRLAAVDTLETFGNQAVAAIPALVGALRDSNKFVRWSSARTLGRLSPRQADEVVPGLMRLLDDREDPSVRIAAAKALELYGEHAKKAVPLLARVINRGDKEYIMAILVAIQGIGTDAAPALPNVAWILSDRTQPPSVRIEAAKTLGRFGALAKDQLPVLRDVMDNDPDEDVRNAASMAVLAVDRPEKQK
jgi:HEAT repeat protein